MDFEMAVEISNENFILETKVSSNDLNFNPSSEDSSNVAGSMKRARILSDSEDEDKDDFKNQDDSNQSVDSPAKTHFGKNTKRLRVLEDSENEDSDKENNDIGNEIHSDQSEKLSLPPSFVEKRAQALDDSDDENSTLGNEILSSHPSPHLKAARSIKKPRILEDSENEDSENENNDASNGIHSHQLEKPLSSPSFTEKESPPDIFSDADSDNADQEETSTTRKVSKMLNKRKMQDEFILKKATKDRKPKGKFDKLLQSRQSRNKKKEKTVEKSEANSEINFSPEEGESVQKLDADIFDAEDSDSDENLELAKQDKSTFRKTLSDVDRSSGDENSEMKKPKKEKKEKKKRENKKARNQEMMEIRSESQRLLRETAIKLPYYKPPKCSLMEFLESRKKPSLPLDIKPFRSETNRVLALRSKHVNQNQQVDENSSQRNSLTCEPTLIAGDTQQTSTEAVINPEFNHSNAAEANCDLPVDQHLLNNSDVIPSISTDTLEKENSGCLVNSESMGFKETLENSTEALKNSTNTLENSTNALENSENSLGELVNSANTLGNFENSLGELMNSTNGLENSENVLENLTNTLEDSTNVLSNAEGALKNSTNALEESTNTLQNSVPLLMSSSLTLNAEVHTKPETILKPEDLLDDDSDDSQNTPDKNHKLVPNSGKLLDSVSETELQETEFEIIKQRTIESVKSFTPHLSGSPNDLIVLNMDDSSNPAENDFNTFIQKFVNHTNSMHKKRVNQEVKLSIVSKDETDTTKLHHSEISVNVSSIKEEPESDTPGVKYLKLKEKLLDEILKKKEAAMIKRRELEKLDNEVDMEEEEAELTDDGESDYDDDNDNVVDDDGNDNIVGGDDDGNDNIVGDDDANDNIVDDGNDNVVGGDDGNDDRGDDVDDNENHNDIVDDNNDIIDNNDSDNVADDDDSVSISFPRKRKRNLFINDEASISEDDNQFVSLKSALIEDSESKSSSTSKTSCESQVSFSGIFPKEKSNFEMEKQDCSITCSEPIEAIIDTNTQFVVPSNKTCSSNEEKKSSIQQDNHRILFQKELANQSQNFTLPDESQPICTFTHPMESQSQSDGSSTPNVKGLLSSRSPGVGIGDELLALCSGSFTDVKEANVPRVVKELCFDNSTPNIADVLDFCSGTFGSRTAPVPEDESSEDSLPEISKHKTKSALSDLDDDSDSCLPDALNNPGSESDHESAEDALSEKSFVARDEIKRAADFFENEAELSGDDVGSDVDEDAEDGEYEEDFIPNEELPSDEELRDQIGKVHLKHLLDEDKRELRLYQELYLEDGELHNDGPGRQRKFTWRNSNTDNMLDGNDSHSESENDDVQEEEKWRLERYERQKFLNEQQNNDKLLENSPIKPKWNGSVNIKILHKTKEPIIVSGKNETDIANISSNSIPKVSAGSILARGEDFLNSLSQKYKVNDNAVGVRTTKHFVFRTVSPKKTNVEPVVTISAEKRPKKKLHKMKPTKKRRSVFDLLDEGV